MIHSKYQITLFCIHRLTGIDNYKNQTLSVLIEHFYIEM